MTEPKLTARASVLLDTLCRVCRERLANGASDTQSRFFGSAEDIRRRYLPDWESRDLQRACYSLQTAGYLEFIALDNQPDEISITDAAVIHSEQRFARAFSSVQSVVENGLKLAQQFKFHSGS